MILHPHLRFDVVSSLLGVLADAPDLDGFYGHVVDLASRVVTPAAACGLTIRRDGRPCTAATSAELALRIDEIQYNLGEGPCLESLRAGEVVQVDDLTADTRWPGYAASALAHGVISSLSLPLTVDGDTIASLNLYSARPRAFADSARDHAEAFTSPCAAALTVVLRLTRQADTQRQLGEAMASRSIIDQALGILMAQQRCTAGEAFALLRQASQHRNRKLRDVAADIITNVTGTPPSPLGFRTPPQST